MLFADSLSSALVVVAFVVILVVVVILSVIVNGRLGHDAVSAQEQYADAGHERVASHPPAAVSQATI